jgi:SAM-dependent methyltransferase
MDSVPVVDGKVKGDQKSWMAGVGGSGAGSEPKSLRLDSPKRLSESMLWDVQHAYWERGSLAFSSGDVPFLLSTAPVVARAYARLIEGFVEDLAAGRFGGYDASEPVYVIDIGCGNGRLAYYLLRALDQDHMAPVRVVHVLVDRARANLDYCASHPKLAPYFESGVLDTALFDAEMDTSLVLERGGVVLEPGKIANPVVAVANYLFCVIPQDVFSVVDGEIHEEHAEVIAADKSVKPSGATFFDEIFVARYQVPFKPGSYGERLDTVVETMAGERGRNHRFLLPAPAIRVLDTVAELSPRGTMLIVGDRPELELPSASDLPSRSEAGGHKPADLYGMDVHGSCISLPVDYGVLAAAARLTGGEMLASTDEAFALAIRVFLQGGAVRARTLRKAFRDAVENPSPDDIWYTAHLTAVEEAPLEGLLADLRVSAYDPDVFMKVYPGVQSMIGEASGKLRRETLTVLGRVYEMDYRVSPTDDLAFGIAILLAKSTLFKEALGYFDKSKADLGPRPQACFNAALCYLNLGEQEKALAELDEAIALEPGYALARSVRSKVLAGEKLD